ncbi:hypothetical protein A5699_16260 [Mycobacterium sp. E802]|uniref:hypothetical protein n=1 Tax=Mycobacterium sp. E802 TaxID=1834152 RepID=UPI0008021FB4|nr:hypothetical protein [Mycobacterium sp. E802]OBG88727.1 hypothetical protein A5699_16260 [Mycobacterium sp. E802]
MPLTCLAVLGAPEAGGDALLQGVYTYAEVGAPPAQLTAMPACVPIVGDLREPLLLPEGCRINILISQDAALSAKSIAGGTVAVPAGSARLAGGQWSYTTSRMEGKVCPDGTLTSATDTVTFDAHSLTGMRTTTWTARCGLQPGMTKQPFTLTYVGPAPVEIDSQPLQCEPGGLRHCS